MAPRNNEELKKNASSPPTELTNDELTALEEIEKELREDERTKMDSEKSERRLTGVPKKDEELRCFWCHSKQSKELSLYQVDFFRKRQSELATFLCCSVEHEKKVINFYHFADRGVIFFQILAFLIPILLLLLFAIFRFYFFLFTIFFSAGLALLIFPLLGDQTLKGLGLKNAIILGRILGGMLLCVGVILFITIGIIIPLS